MGYGDAAKEANKLYLAELDRKIAAYHSYNRKVALRRGAIFVVCALLALDLIWIYQTKRGSYAEGNLYREADYRSIAPRYDPDRRYRPGRMDNRNGPRDRWRDGPYWAQGR